MPARFCQFLKHGYLLTGTKFKFKLINSMSYNNLSLVMYATARSHGDGVGVNSLARKAKMMQIQMDDQGPCLCGDSFGGWILYITVRAGRKKEEEAASVLEQEPAGCAEGREP